MIPVYDEPAQVAETIASVRRALSKAPRLLPAEIVVADDGSTVDIAGPAIAAAGADLPTRVVRLEANSGRFAAREHGLGAAQGEYVLFVDAGVTVEAGSLEFVASRLEDGRRVWNAHTIHDTGGTPTALFWNVVSSMAFGAYVDDPRETSFGIDDFDRFPKGTTCFLAPRALLSEAFAAFESAYADTRNANDDGPIIRYVAGRERVNIAPGFSCVYRPRRTVRSFVKHALHRGVVFVDGHGRRESRFFPITVAFFPISLGIAVAAARRPLVVPATAAVATAAAAGVAASLKRRPVAEVASFAALAPVYALAHGLGMWRGLALAVSARARRR